MMDKFYDMIFKRKSIRKFDDALSISEEEMELIRQQIKALVPLEKDIRVSFKIVKREETSARFGEYCLLLYSEQKPRYLLNAGYMLEQMDLFFASLDIGACWVGMAKPEKLQNDGLEYVIMLAIGKSRPEDFRKDLSECKRKDSSMIWQGEFDAGVTDVVRCAPSAGNSQPWQVVSSDHDIKIYRDTSARSFIMPKKKLHYFNGIDMGIFLYFLEVVLEHRQMAFTRKLSDESDADTEKIAVAEYHILQ
ncbi:MAG TPA: nitroreductase family protein [Anaerolineaceae bacterium]|nr:nitroreductase family protein [Anaerolineaceae bacterium]